LYALDESKLGRIVEHLDDFAVASGLQVNRDKSVVIKLNPKAPPVVHAHGFRTLGLDELCRYLGIQVGRSVPDAEVWQLTVSQIEKRLAMARIKTHSVYQRAQLAAGIIIPKILYIARHHWPSVNWVQRIDTRLRNFVWTGNSADEIPKGSGALRWMNKKLADLPAGVEGLGVPNLELELLTMATQVVARWCYDPKGVRENAARLLSRAGEPVQVDLYLTTTKARPGIKTYGRQVDEP
jgi:hypothetical protein